jgi:hypothetical protein
MQLRIQFYDTRVFVAVSAILSVLIVPMRATGPEANVQKAVAEWAQVRSETVRIESDWAWQKTLMQSTLAALKERASQLEAKRAELEARTSEENRDMTELKARLQAMGEAENDAAQQLRVLSDRLVRMRASLPPRLSAALELPYRSMTAPDASLGERMRQTMVILNRCALFNRTIAIGDETISATGGGERLMEVIYWGLSRGYALDRTAGLAYIGAPTEHGWTWAPAPGFAPQLARLLDVGRGQAAPDLVTMPVQANQQAALGQH